MEANKEIQRTEEFFSNPGMEELVAKQQAHNEEMMKRFIITSVPTDNDDKKESSEEPWEVFVAIDPHGGGASSNALVSALPTQAFTDVVIPTIKFESTEFIATEEARKSPSLNIDASTESDSDKDIPPLMDVFKVTDPQTGGSFSYPMITWDSMLTRKSPEKTTPAPIPSERFRGMHHTMPFHLHASDADDEFDDDMPPLEEVYGSYFDTVEALIRAERVQQYSRWREHTPLNRLLTLPHGHAKVFQSDFTICPAPELLVSDIIGMILLASVSNPIGRIEYITGPMFAGKSTELIRRCRRLKHANMDVILIKPASDTRSGDVAVTTHSGESMPANIIAKTLSEALVKIFQASKPCQVIAIDEAQMFDDVDIYCPLLADAGFIVITAGCETTFERKPFKNYYKLSYQAETVTKLTAVCEYCHGDASFTSLRDPAFAKRVDANGILIGGADIFEPTCRRCIEPSKRPSKKSN